MSHKYFDETIEHLASSLRELRNVFHRHEFGFDAFDEAAEVIQKIPRPMSFDSIGQLRERLTWRAAGEKAIFPIGEELRDGWRVLATNVPFQELGA